MTRRLTPSHWEELECLALDLGATERAVLYALVACEESDGRMAADLELRDKAGRRVPFNRISAAIVKLLSRDLIEGVWAGYDQPQSYRPSRYVIESVFGSEIAAFLRTGRIPAHPRSRPSPLSAGA